MSIEDKIIDCSEVINNLKNAIKIATNKVYSKKSYVLNLFITVNKSTLYNDLDLLTDELADEYKILIEKTVDLTGIKENIFSSITDLNNDDRIGGIYIDNLDLDLLNYESVIYSMVHPAKDVGALNVVNSGLLFYEQQLIIPPQVSAIMKLLEANNIKVAGKHIIIINKSVRLGKPLMMMLLQKDANVSLLDVQMTDFKKICKTSNLIISGINQPNSLNASSLKKDTFLIDIGDYLSIDGNLQLDDNIDVISKYINYKDIKKLTLLFILYNFLRTVFFNHEDLFE